MKKKQNPSQLPHFSEEAASQPGVLQPLGSQIFVIQQHCSGILQALCILFARELSSWKIKATMLPEAFLFSAPTAVWTQWPSLLLLAAACRDGTRNTRAFSLHSNEDK